MTDRKENIDFWLMRAFMACFFFFILSISIDSSNFQVDSSSIFVEQVVDVNNSAILIEPEGISGHDCSFAQCELKDWKIRDQKYSIEIYNSAINQRFISERVKYIKFKPKLLTINLLQLRISSGDTYPLVS